MFVRETRKIKIKRLEGDECLYVFIYSICYYEYKYIYIYLYM